MRFRILGALLSLILLFVVVLPALALDEKPLSGECVLYLSEWSAKVYNVDQGTSETLLEGPVLALEANRDNTHGLAVVPTESGFVVIHDNWVLEMEGYFLGGSVSEAGHLLFGVRPPQGPPTVYLHLVGEESALPIASGTLPSWGPNAQYAVTTSDGLILVSEEGETTMVDPAGSNASWSPSGRFLAYNTFAGVIRILDLDTGEYAPFEWAEGYFGYRPVWVDDDTLLVGAFTTEPEGEMALFLVHPFDGGELLPFLAEDGRNLHDAFPTQCAESASAPNTSEEEPTPQATLTA